MRKFVTYLSALILVLLTVTMPEFPASAGTAARSRHIHRIHPAGAHRPAADPFSAAWAKAFHPRHASRGVVAVRGEPLRGPAAGHRLPGRSSARRPAPPAAAVRPFCAVPSAPGSASASAGANQVSVTWSAAPGNGTSVSSYVIREVTGPDVGASIATDGGATSAVLTGLTGGTAATFSVLAESGCGSGPVATTSAVTPTGPSTTYLSSVLASKPLALYRLNEPSGTVMADSSGHRADGNYSGQETQGQAPALASDPAPSVGYTSCCSGAGSASLSLPQYNAARTVEGWFSTTSSTAGQAIAGYGQTSTDEAFIVSVSAQGIGVDGYNDYLQFPTPRPVDDGNWHFIAVTYATGTVSVYLDGLEIGTAPFSGVINTINGGSFSLAAFPNYNVFNGDLADVAVYSSALSAATIAAHFAAAGYSRPTAAHSVNAFYGGSNTADVTWGHATASGAPVSAYLVSAVGGPHGVPSVSVPADATAARLTGLAAGSYTFQVVALDAYGSGQAAGSAKTLTVPGSASTYASVVLSSSPSVFYRLADSDRGVLADSSGHGATGSYTSQVSLGQSGPLGNDAAAGISSDANGPAGGGDPSLPLYAQARSVEGWINTTSGGENFLAGYGSQNTGQGFLVAVWPNAVLVSGYSDDLTFTSSTPLDNGTWHFIAVTTTGTSATVYVDGVSLGTQNFGTALDTLPTAQGLEIGAGPQGCCGYFSGSLADIAVFPSALSAATVAAQFAASGLSRPPVPGSVAATAGANKAMVSWSAPAGADPAVSGYLVTAVKGSTAANALSVPGSASSATVTGLAGGTSYTFKVQAVNAYGPGAAATSAAVTPTGSASTYASVVLSSAPSVFYRLADSDPGVLADSSGHGASGSYTSQVSLGQAGPLGNDAAAGISSDANGPAGSGDPSLPLYNQPRTVEGWINTTSGGENFLAGYGSQNTSQGFLVAVYPNAVLVSGYSDDLTFTSPAPLNDGNWHFIAVTTTGTSATVYVDGVSLGAQNFTTALDTLPTSQGLEIGAGPQGCCGYFSGSLADIAVFPSALSAATVAAQFAASGVGRPAAPGSVTATGGSNKATVSWDAPAGAGPAVSGYLVTAVKGSAAANAVSVPGSASSATVTGLAGGTSYTFKVQAVNAYGPGAAATSAAVTPTGSASTYASVVLSSAPSVFYRLADTDRGVLADSSGRGATGTYTSQVSLGQSGPLGNDAAAGISSDANGPAGGGDPSLPLYAQARSVEGWINTTSGGENFLAGYGSQNTGQGFLVAVYPNAVLVSGYSDDLTFTSPAPLNDGNWHFIAVTTTGTSATVYVDGVSLGTRNFGTTLDTLPTSQGLEIGAGPQGCCGYFSGSLADIAVFPSALSAATISSQFDASGLSRPPAPGSVTATGGSNKATVSWNAPAGADPQVTGYLVTAVKGTTAVNAVSVPGSASSTTVTGLAGGTSYTFKVQAVNAYGPGAAATSAAVTPTGSASTYASAVLSSSPSVFYRLADSDPGVLADSSGHGASGSYTSQVSLGQAGPLANDPAPGISSDANGPAGSGDPSLPLYNQPRTVEGWINTTSGGENFLAGYGSQNTGQGFTVAVQPNAVLVSGYSDDLTFTSSTSLDNGTWHLIAVTTTGTSATVYVDGTSLGTQNFGTTLDTLPTSQGLEIGAGPQGCCGYFSGSLADIAVFPSALSAATISSQFAASGDLTARLSRHAHSVTGGRS